jgi:hypothetical protein
MENGHFLNYRPMSEPRAEKKHSGTANGINHCEIFVLSRQFTNVTVSCLIPPGMPQVGEL